jgi:predicted Zn-dependent protease
MTGSKDNWRGVRRCLSATHMRRLSLLLLLAVVTVGCAHNPVTGKNQLSLVSRDQEIQMGQQAKQEVVQSIGLVKDPALEQYVSSVGMKMAKVSERPDLPWSFQVVDDAAVNAFALPGGPVFVTRGLLTHITNEAELAAVLGHEIGHITAKHSVSQISKAQLAQMGLGIGSIFVPEKLRGLGQLASAGAALLFLKFGRDDESQADRLGFRYALNQHYDVRQMIDLFQMLDAVGGKEAGRLPEWLSTHPNPENRVAATEKLLQKTGPLDTRSLQVDRPEYLHHLDGVVFGENPRNGFFRGQTFYQPDLGFQLSFPQGWVAQNQPSAVVAMSGQKDAALQLQLAGTIPPEEAARRFFSAQGIQPLKVTQGTLHSLPATAGYFQAQTEQGVIAGIVEFISYEGRTYQLLGFTGANRLSSYAPVLSSALASFGPIKDRSALDVKAARVQIETAPHAMSAQEAFRAFPETIPVETFLLINGLEPNATVPAGALIKTVSGGTPASPTTGTLQKTNG